MQKAEVVGGEAFGQEVCNLIKSEKVVELNFFPDEVDVHLDVFCASM
jgi:hypothetical protein